MAGIGLGPVPEEPPVQGELLRLCPLGSCWILGLVSLLLIIKKVSLFI